MASDRKHNILDIFYRALRGEDIKVAPLAAEYGVTKKTVQRCIADIRAFLADKRELMGYADLPYNHSKKVYQFRTDEFLSDKELFSVAKMILGTRAFSPEDTTLIVSKLKRLTSAGDREKLDEIIRKELRHYSPVKHDCDSVIENLWLFINAITEKREITITYYRKDRTYGERRIQPVSLMFSEYYFYLIAYYPGEYDEPRYFRADRITRIVQHRKRFADSNMPDYDDDEQRKRTEQIPPGFNEGELRKRNQYMFYGKLRRIRFWYTGPSVQAIKDKLPTATIIEQERGKYLLEAEVYGDGIKMFLLSQGSMVQVISPDEFVREMQEEIKAMQGLYG